MKLTPRSLLRRGPLLVVSLVGLLTATLVAATPQIAHSTTAPRDTTTTTISSTTTTTIPSTSTTTTTTTLPAEIPARLKLAWPKQGSAAIAIPALSIAASSPAQPPQAIASLTKLMSTWVVLHHLPLTYSQHGPCLSVNASDVAVYDFDVATDQSSVAVKFGETLCEGTLLRGLLVHSAGNYVQLLVTMLGMTQSQFVNEMNRDARALGMTHTRYADYSGISPYDRSTAHDQAIIAVALMTNEPIVRTIVALPRVKLPVVGVVISYTPLVGQDGVVGVKSGFTNMSGGCDVMAINYAINGTVITIYAVDLGQHGGNALGIAGQANLVLIHSLRSQFARVAGPTGVVVEWEGWPGYVVPTTTTTTTTTTSTTSTTTTTTTIP